MSKLPWLDTAITFSDSDMEGCQHSHDDPLDELDMDELDMRDELNTRPMPSEEQKPIQLEDQPEHLAYIRAKLVEEVKDLLILFLKQNMEVFTWK